MTRKVSCKNFVALVVLPLLSNFSNATAQDYMLEKMELVNMGAHYRIFLHGSGLAKYADQFSESPLQLNLYLRDAKLNLKESYLTYEDSPVRAIAASQWKRFPWVVKIAIDLRRIVGYQIQQKMDGLIYVDLMESSNGAHHNASHQADSPPGIENSGNGLGESLRLDKYASDRIPEALTSRDLISLDVRDAKIADVLRLLAKQSGLNIVASRDVGGTITVRLVNVTTKEALDLIAKTNGYDYVVSGEAILVKPREKFRLDELQTKVYRLKYVDASNLKSTLSQVLSPQAKIQVFHYDFQPTEEDRDGQTSGKKIRSSTLLVTDTRENFPRLEAMIETLDVPVPQIMIEAKLIEISPQSDEQLGINWSKTINAQIFREVLLPSGQVSRHTVEVPLDGGSVSFGTLTVGEYGAVLDFLSSETHTKLVSNPRILAMDNQEAVISVGTNVPIPQINRGVGGQGDVVTFEYRDVKISLRVTPHVAEDNTISLYVHPIIEEITGEIVAGENRAPITSKREVETVVNLKNNETMVIGGLIKERTVDTVSKVWLLGDIPLIGNFFRHKNKSMRQTDLLIFITPRLIGGS